MGGVFKPGLRIGGRRLLDLALDGVALARQVVVVGVGPVPAGVLLTREDPPFSGPAVAVDAGFAVLGDHAEFTLLLASDLPDAPAAVAELLASGVSAGWDGTCLLDESGRRQWLLGLYRSTALAEALVSREGAAMYRLLAGLRLHEVVPQGASVADVDTAADLRRWAVQDQEDTE